MRGTIVAAALVAASFGATGVVHAKARKASHPAVSCKAVRSALASGKSKEDVAAEMKTTTAVVDRCQANASAKHAKKSK